MFKRFYPWQDKMYETGALFIRHFQTMSAGFGLFGTYYFGIKSVTSEHLEQLEEKFTTLEQSVQKTQLEQENKFKSFFENEREKIIQETREKTRNEIYQEILA